MNSIRLTQLRKKAKLTQKELAEKIHVSTATVSAWENGKVKITPKNREKLKSFFANEDTSDLFETKSHSYPAGSKKGYDNITQIPQSKNDLSDYQNNGSGTNASVQSDLLAGLSPNELASLKQTAIMNEKMGTTPETVKLFMDMLDTAYGIYRQNCLSAGEFNILKQLIFSQLIFTGDNQNNE